MVVLNKIYTKTGDAGKPRWVTAAGWPSIRCAWRPTAPSMS
jgi:cob(I)alamin adenosyltransferase